MDLVEQVCPLPPVNTLVDLPRLGLRKGDMSPVSKMPDLLPKLPEDDESPLSMPRQLTAHKSPAGKSLLWLPMPLPIDTSLDNSPLATSERLASFWPVTSYVECSAPVRKRSRHVTFASSPTHSVHRSECGVQPYSEVYGAHPRDFDFDEFGNIVSKSEFVESPSQANETIDFDFSGFERNVQRSESGWQMNGGMDTFDFSTFAGWSANVQRPKWNQPYSVGSGSYGKYDFRMPSSTTAADFSMDFKGFAQQTWNAPTAA